jgi:hypothetical protein
MEGDVMSIVGPRTKRTKPSREGAAGAPRPHAHAEFFEDAAPDAHEHGEGALAPPRQEELAGTIAHGSDIVTPDDDEER